MFRTSQTQASLLQRAPNVSQKTTVDSKIFVDIVIMLVLQSLYTHPVTLQKCVVII